MLRYLFRYPCIEGRVVTKSTPAKKKIHFEKAMDELETLVNDLETGDLSLDDALKTFEKGVGLTRQCQEALQQAEQRVQILLSATEADDADQQDLFTDFVEDDR
jgi:exodeoxyribonuclease VII small subunit